MERKGDISMLYNGFYCQFMSTGHLILTAGKYNPFESSKMYMHVDTHLTHMYTYYPYVRTNK